MSAFAIPFSGRPHDYTDHEIELVVQMMASSETLTQGGMQKIFEEKFAHYIGVNYAFAVSSATAALELAAQLCQIQLGEEVVVPGHTFTSSAYPFAKKGAKLVWADIDFETRVMGCDQFEKCITDKTKVVVVPHLYGYGADMPRIVELAKEKGIIVVEDVAQAIGVDIGGKKAGAYGDISVYSFHNQKNITTLGEGGMITVKNDKYAKIIPMLRHNGHCKFNPPSEEYWLPAMGDLDLPELEGDWLWPNNYSIGEIQCALGAKLIDRVEQINSDKRIRALAFIDRYSNFPELKFHRVDSSRHNYHLLVACLLEGDRNEFIRNMSERYSIQCVVQYYPLYRYPLYKKLGFGIADCPNSDMLFDNMISFPFYLSLTELQLEEIVSAGLEILNSFRHS